MEYRKKEQETGKRMLVKLTGRKRGLEILKGIVLQGKGGSKSSREAPYCR